jgi:hypothetical protein
MGEKLLKDKIDSIVGNILRQMNAKVKLDLYQVDLPLLKNSMLIGIDIIAAAGNRRLIGCSATISGHHTKCFTKVFTIKQPVVGEQKRTELLAQKLSIRDFLETEITEQRTQVIREFVRLAMTAYRGANKVMPE